MNKCLRSYAEWETAVLLRAVLGVILRLSWNLSQNNALCPTERSVEILYAYNCELNLVGVIGAGRCGLRGQERLLDVRRRQMCYIGEAW